MRKRDYKAEYYRRNERAKGKYPGGYSQKRRIQERFNRAADKAAGRLANPDYFRAYFEAEDMDEILEDDTIFWEAFRNYYGKGTPA